MTLTPAEARATSSLNGGSAAYVEALYEAWLADPQAVEETWRPRFEAMRAEAMGTETPRGPVQAQYEALARQPRYAQAPGSQAAGTGPAAPSAGDHLPPHAAAKQAAVLRLINYYRVRGHQIAHLDPLGLAPVPVVEDLDPAFHKLTPADMDQEFDTGSLASAKRLKLSEIIKVMKQVYTDTVGVEYMYLTETAEKRWLQQRLEANPFAPKVAPSQKKDILQQLVAAEGIERYLHNRYVGQKRFSLEGGDSFIPSMDEILRGAADGGVEEVVIGMAHRGRLNVLVNVLGKAPSDLFNEFEGKYTAEALTRAGDVKYHMGFSTDVDVDGKRLHLVLAFNPSHLEIVNPVVEGSVKARQTRRDDERGERVVPVLVHGDAAFAGQGVVMETLQLSQAKGYSTGGTIHLVINNQIGFTTPNPIEIENEGHQVRTSRYCTDIAKLLESPVFHVNGDDPEAVVFVTRMAVDFRNEFHKDVVIDICCYRRLGHNEADEPSVTSPVMYEAIRKHPTPLAIYAKKLMDEGVVTQEQVDGMVRAYRDGLDKGVNTARTTLGLVGNQYTVNWAQYATGGWDTPAQTAAPLSQLSRLSEQLLTLPEGFTLHPRVAKIMDDRRKMAAGEQPMDWGFAETMAYATLADDGFSLRLTGQDARRGTFFHRHATLHDAKTGESYTPLRQLGAGKNDVVILDTLLSEEGVLGFEYGYATTDPNTLVIWEAQFGDFANGAQVLTDQFIASGYTKWARLCGLSLFLPHGYEGQGPEHSSARLERFLQLCAGNNMQVCVPSTPAQMFHMIRRQMKRAYKLPLVVMTPKSLLRHPLSVSLMSELTDGAFRPVIGEVDTDTVTPGSVTRTVFCSGKVYYDLLEARRKRSLNNVALIRIEQLYPFPAAEFKAQLALYPNSSELVWAQEEPENQGAWYQIKHRLATHMADRHRLIYATRPGSASTAVGYSKVHAKELAELTEAALVTGSVVRPGSA